MQWLARHYTTLMRIGIDEAGRGPMVGPLIYGGLLCSPTTATALSKAGVADSKTLSAGRREELFRTHLEGAAHVGFQCWALRAEAINGVMLEPGPMTLNSVCHLAVETLVRAALRAHPAAKLHVFVDTVGPPAKMEASLQGRFPSANVSVSVGGDARWPVVSAASIAAKVWRDRLTHAALPGAGSGYVMDPATQRWLHSALDPLFGAPALLRFAWKNVAKLVEERCAKVIWHGPAPKPKPNTLAQWFKAKTPAKADAGGRYFGMANKYGGSAGAKSAGAGAMRGRGGGMTRPRGGGMARGRGRGDHGPRRGSSNTRGTYKPRMRGNARPQEAGVTPVIKKRAYKRRALG